MKREEAIKQYIMPALKRTWNDDKCIEIISAIEQDPCEVVLDKIRDEIEKTYINITYQENKNGASWGLRKALDIIDKYKGESEGTDADSY